MPAFAFAEGSAKNVDGCSRKRGPALLGAVRSLLGFGGFLQDRASATRNLSSSSQASRLFQEERKLVDWSSREAPESERLCIARDYYYRSSALCEVGHYNFYYK